ncbi:MAG: alpha/beta fold hydrolase [Ilumatobacter sp.]|uniref:alpha/beta fold hydrolase n=2 Tax=Ilumatobacter sp. TaxID=1967498 RepID=UPI00329A59E5
MLLRPTLGQMESVMLVHGWGGSFESTWQRSGFAALLQDGGKAVIGVDLLGHGTAPKPHDAEAYGDLTERIVDALPDEPVSAVGFSLGASTLLRTAIAHPDRFERIVLAGIGRNVFERDHSGAALIADGLRSLIDGADPSTLPQSVRVFAQYAQQPGNDLIALAAVMSRPAGFEVDAAAISAVRCPVLVVVGEQDFVYPADELADAFPDGRCVTLPKTDHFATTESFGFFDAALEFLGAI